MIVATAQPISGVSANRETEIEVIYPGVAGGAIGKLVGVIMGGANSLPFTPLRLAACVVVGTAMVPLALAGYFLKLLGSCFVLTNRSVFARSILTARKGTTVALSDIASVGISRGAGYEFHRVGDVELLGAQGNVLLTIPAIAYPERLKQIILDARAARQEADASLAVIQRRK